MRVLFFGTAEFAVPTLEALAASAKHRVIAVVTQPDKPRGRGLQLAASPVKRIAVDLGIPVLQPKRVRSESFLAKVRELRPEVMVLAAFGQLIPQVLLDIPPFGPINVHGSLLPAYRGAAPIQRSIMNGDTITGVTTMWMDASLDTGDILLSESMPIHPDDTTDSLTQRMAARGAPLLLETLEKLAAGDCPRTPQNHAEATNAPALTPQDSTIDWAESAGRIRDRVRALSPRPGAFATFRGKRLKIWQAAVGPFESERPGEVLRVSRDAVAVASGHGVVILLEVQAENSRRMTAGDWARGVRIAAGDRFMMEP
jgi:methionyl-tRNA formyltransferase